MDKQPWDKTCSIRLGKFGRRHLELYKELHRRTGPKLWELLPKHHLFLHVIEESSVNPRRLWNYGEEDEIGTVAKLAKTVSYIHLETMLMPKYRIVFTLD